jgi:cytochrome c oxidase cbb3-type subunit I/II
MTGVYNSSKGGESDASRDDSSVETFSYDDGIVRKFALATLFWGIVAVILGIYVGLLVVYPQLNFGSEFLSFGRIRPLHTNAAIFAFGGNAMFAAVYYATQRLCKARMWSSVLSFCHFWGWQIVILLAIATIPMGWTQGKEYAEMEWPIDLLIAVVWVLFFGVNFFMTLKVRRERHMYVSLWFFIASIVTVAILHVGNNVVFPLTPEKGFQSSYSIYAGVQDALMQWWYGHNLIAFLLTMPFLGLMYYFFPKAANAPVYSYKLCIVHFWSLVFIYVWLGPHHLHYTALPTWASSLGMIFSLLLLMPSWGGVLNGFMTLRGASSKIANDPVLSFFYVAIAFYGLASLEGPLLSIKSFNALTHNSDWTIAHVHASTLGWNGFLAFGMIYWLTPRLFQANLWSPKLAVWHFRIGLLGILTYIIPTYIAGAMQANYWHSLNPQGGLAHPEFLKATTSSVPMYCISLVGGILYLIGAIFCFVNFVMTWKSRPASYEVPVYSAPRLTREFQDATPSESNLSIVLDAAKSIDVWSRLDWHRRWERLPSTFTFWVIAAVVVASALEILPVFLIRANIPTLASVQPYTPLELIGRDIYVAEGCFNCHTQMVRPLVSETKRFGDYSLPGEFIYDRPFQWGSRRIGPDLAREGGRQSNFWHLQHLANPRDVNKESLMPEFSHLLKNKLNFKSISERVAAAAKMGTPYTQELEFNEETKTSRSVEMAIAQAQRIAVDIVTQGGPLETEDKQVIALIAYLQRLGIDRNKPAPAATAPPTENPQVTPESQQAGQTAPDSSQSDHLSADTQVSAGTQGTGSEKSDG